MLGLLLITLIEYVLIRHVHVSIVANLDTRSFLYSLYFILSYPILLGLPIYVYVKITKINLSTFFRLSNDAKYFLALFSGLLLIVFSLILFAHLSLPAGSVEMLGNTTPFKHSDLLAHGLRTGNREIVSRLLIPETAVVLIFAPFFEELFFTAIIYGRLRDKMRMVAALCSGGLVFAVFHTGMSDPMSVSTAAFFILQLLSFWLFDYTKSLWPSIVYHQGRNLSRLAYLLLYHLNLS